MDHHCVTSLQHLQQGTVQQAARGFPWLPNADKRKVDEANFFVDQCIKACEVAATRKGYFILEHLEDLGAVGDEKPGSVWQWEQVLDLIPKFGSHCFAIHHCRFGAISPKPTGFLTNMRFQMDAAIFLCHNLTSMFYIRDHCRGSVGTTTLTL